ncbi:MAG: SufD family Fe-S cluster assembly protein [Erysipelotrichaceae bacterium]|nr:SufD family Fe-S cluster assembly protein [Erysipelotrichaceae bacterium]
MNKYTLSSQFYIVLYNGECQESHLPDRVCYHDGTISFCNISPVEVQIIYLLDKHQSMDVSIEIEKQTEVSIIESKILATDSELNRKILIKADAIVHLFGENDSSDGEIVEDIHLLDNALCQYGYAELSDGNFKGTYHYYLDGEGAEAKVRMAILSKEKEDKHYEVLIQHNKPHTYGQMDNYGVVKDEGKLVIDGIGTITKGQSGSASHQNNRIMVFDEKCKASANPFLYIDEYDVKASHAAGVGKMDEEHLYYLQSRGLTKKQAMQLITYGYLRPVIEVIDNDMLKERFEKALSKVGE